MLDIDEKIELSVSDREEKEVTVSVIIPCYNQGIYLNETLDSVLSQSHKQWECIIVNDGSTDQSESIARAWCKKDSRFKYLSKLNAGLPSARNEGIAQAIGDYILPLDADDLIHKTYLQQALHAFNNNKSLSLVYCKAQKFGIENGQWELNKYDYKYLLVCNSIFCSAIYRKTDWSRIGGYDETFKNGFEDWDFWIRLLNSKSLVYQIPKILFFYRIKELSMYKNMKLVDIESAKWKIFQKNQVKYQEYFKSPSSVFEECTGLKYENERLQNHIHNILSSKSYVIGNMLLKPMSFLKRVLKKSEPFEK